MEHKSEIDNLLDTPTPLTVGGKELALTPMRFGALARALRLLGPLAEHLTGGAVSISSLLGVDGSRLIELMAMLSGESVEWVEQLGTDDAVRLAGVLYEVNQVFFARRVSPVLTETLTHISAALARPGVPQETHQTPRSTPGASGQSSPLN